MGTNYYWHKEGAERERCHVCGQQYAPPIHIGKSSGGWTFTFHATEAIRSWAAWRSELQTPGRIVDEYDREIPFAEFQALVESKRDEKMSHAVYVKTAGEFSYRGDYLDQEGHSFSPGEFS